MESKLIGRFNHRILLLGDDKFNMHTVAVVYYDLDGTPTDYTQSMCEASDIDSLYLEKIESLEAFARPVLDVKDIDFSRSVLDREDREEGMVHTEKWDL